MLDPKKKEHGIRMTIKCKHKKKKINVFQSLGTDEYEIKRYCVNCFIKQCFKITKQEDL